jgi:hypothetical protein
VASEASRVRRILGRHPIALLALIAVLAAVLVAPRLARPALERHLTRALGEPVKIASLSWKPIRGIVSAEKVIIGPPERLLVVGRATLDFTLQALLRGEIAFDSIELADVIGQADLDRNLDLRVRGLEATQDWLAARRVTSGARPTTPAPGAPPPGVPSHAATSGALVVATDRITIERVRLVVHDTSRSPAHRLTVDLERFETGPFTLPLDASRLDLRADFRGALEDRLETSKTGGAGESLAVKLGGVLGLRRDTEAGRDEARLDVDAKDLRVSGPLDTLLSSSKVSIGGLRFDLVKQEIAAARTRVDDLELRAALSPEGVVLPVPTLPRAANPSPDAKPWKLTTGPVEVRSGKIEVPHGEKPLVVAVDSGYWGGFEPGTPTSLQAKLEPAIGGSAALEGRLGGTPLGAEVRVKLNDIPLPALAALITASPLQFSRGTTGGELDVSFGGPRASVRGDVWAAGLFSVPPSPDHPEEVLACNRIEATLAIDPSSRHVEVDSMKVTDPYVMVRRREAGLFPLNLLAGGAPAPSTAKGTPSPAGAARAATPADSAPPLDVHVATVQVTGARGEFYDTIVRPSYWTSLGDASIAISNLHLPDATIEGFTVNGKLDEISPLEAKGRLDAQGLHATSQVQQFHLPPLNPYVSPALAYTLDSGLMTMTSEIDISRESFRASNDLVLSRLGLSPAGDDVFARDLGVPLTIALALMKDYQGRIALSVPVEGTFGSSSFRLGSVVLQAIKRALLGLIQAPIRLLGSLFGTNGPPDAFAIDPIPFAPGASTLDAAAQTRVDQIGRVLSAHPGLQLVLKAQLAASDAAALRIDELRRRLEPKAAAANGGPHGEVPDLRTLEPLRPLLSGKADAQERAALESELERLLPFPAEGLRELGAARARAAQTALVSIAQGSSTGDGQRLIVAPAAPASEAALDRAPGVYAELRAD